MSGPLTYERELQTTPFPTTAADAPDTPESPPPVPI